MLTARESSTDGSFYSTSMEYHKQQRQDQAHRPNPLNEFIDIVDHFERLQTDMSSQIQTEPNQSYQNSHMHETQVRTAKLESLHGCTRWEQ